jgi:hypothetical protein
MLAPDGAVDEDAAAAAAATTATCTIVDDATDDILRLGIAYDARPCGR